MALSPIDLNSLFEEQKGFLDSFWKCLKELTNSKDIDERFVYQVDKHFWELI